MALLAGCAGSTPNEDVPQAVFTIPTPPPAEPAAPLYQRPLAVEPAPLLATPAPVGEVAPTEGYQNAELFEIPNPLRNQEETDGEDAQAIAALTQSNTASQRDEDAEDEPSSSSATTDRESDDDSARAALDAILQRNTHQNSDAARNAALRKAARNLELSKQQRANPPVGARRPPLARRAETARPALGRFATRRNSVEEKLARPPSAPEVAAATLPAAPVQTPPAAPPAPPERSFAERVVAQAPLPSAKPFILRNAPAPLRKPAQTPAEPPVRAFDIVPAALLGNVTPDAVTPDHLELPAEARDPLSARFFPTPGKPSTLGTDQDQAIDVVALGAARYGIGSDAAKAIDTNADTVEWADGLRLVETGEVEALSIKGESDLELTLCSGRTVLTTPPDLTAAATLNAPQIICGQNKALALR